MGRLSAVITAASLLALASPAGAAELTRVATAAEPDNAFSLDFSVRWERTQKQATITRERTTGATPFARVEDLAELRYSEISNLIIPRVAAGLYQDVELHFEMPYHLGREVSWKYASGITLQGESSVTTPGVDANGAACTTDCPLFPAGVRNTTVWPVASSTTARTTPSRSGWSASTSPSRPRPSMTPGQAGPTAS
jgi:hypothetical protein